MSEAAVNQMFRAFSDPTRLRIMHLLAMGELCVGDLVEVLGVPQPTASRHLARLRTSDLVQVRRDGRWMFYSLAEAGSSFHARLLDCLSCCLGEVPELRADRERLTMIKKAGSCCPRVPAVEAEVR